MSGVAVARISAEDAKALIDLGGSVVIDVRERHEVDASGKVPGALVVPRGLFESRADPSSAEHDPRIDPAKTVILYCASGVRAASAGAALRALGFSDVRNMGGFNDWDQENFPIESAEV